MKEVFPGAVMVKSGIVVLVTLAMLASAAAATLACDDLHAAPGGVVVQVIDGNTVVLDSGLVVRLIGMQAPKLALDREGIAKWPKADAAKAALSALVLNKPVRLGYDDEKIDRYERALAHLFVVVPAGEIWVQQQMVAAGMARVYSSADNRHCLDQLYAAEGRARLAGLGIWSDPYYSVRAADRPTDWLARAGHYELVEGRVLLADQVGRRVYLNFGRFWKEDFTAVIEAKALRLFAKAGLDPMLLDGALVRIRGWVDDWDGPRIEVTHPEQIEVLATR